MFSGLIPRYVTSVKLKSLKVILLLNNSNVFELIICSLLILIIFILGDPMNSATNILFGSE